ncbi:hypothetical protein PR048_012276 [Dryococelus australis]|uniref:Uncharacterized protein n=1 Tax=Dryococelus australis TaxID=614101 RepID=A0ABQ9HP55_9NEOP|nr:hypothetical protein PR048_012276 [Dryococelus australis]
MPYHARPGAETMVKADFSIAKQPTSSLRVSRLHRDRSQPLDKRGDRLLPSGVLYSMPTQLGPEARIIQWSGPWLPGATPGSGTPNLTSAARKVLSGIACTLRNTTAAPQLPRPERQHRPLDHPAVSLALHQSQARLTLSQNCISQSRCWRAKHTTTGADTVSRMHGFARYINNFQSSGDTAQIRVSNRPCKMSQIQSPEGGASFPLALLSPPSRRDDYKRTSRTWLQGSLLHLHHCNGH